MSSTTNDITLWTGNDLLNWSSDGWFPKTLSISGIAYPVKCAQASGINVSLTYECVSMSVWAFYLPDRNSLPQITVRVDGDIHQWQDPSDASDDPQQWHMWEPVYVSNLKSENHTLDILIDDASGYNPFCINKFEVTAPASNGVLLESGSTSSSSSSATSSTASSTSSSVSASKAHASAGPIVGGVIGAIALTLIICGALFWWYRRSHKNGYARTGSDDDESAYGSEATRRRNSRLPLRNFLMFGSRRRPKSAPWLEARPHVLPTNPPMATLYDDLDHSGLPTVEKRPSIISEKTVSLSDLGLAPASRSPDVPHPARDTLQRVDSPPSMQQYTHRVDSPHSHEESLHRTDSSHSRYSEVSDLVSPIRSATT